MVELSVKEKRALDKIFEYTRVYEVVRLFKHNNLRLSVKECMKISEISESSYYRYKKAISKLNWKQRLKIKIITFPVVWFVRITIGFEIMKRNIQEKLNWWRMKWDIFWILTVPNFYWDIRGIKCEKHGTHAQNWITGKCGECAKERKDRLQSFLKGERPVLIMDEFGNDIAG